MGNFQSNLTTQMLSEITNIVNSVVNNVYNNATQQCTASNNLSIQIGGPDCGYPTQASNSNVNVNQIAGTICRLNAVNNNELNAQFTNQLKSQLKSYIDQNAQNQQGWFATALSFQINGLDTSEKIANTIVNSFTNNFTNQCSAVNNASNIGKLQVCGIYDRTNFNWGQNATTLALTSCVNENLSKAVTSNVALNELVNRTDQALASKQGGVGELFRWIILVVAIVAVCGLIGLLLKLLLSHKTKPVIV